MISNWILKGRIWCLQTRGREERQKVCSYTLDADFCQISSLAGASGILINLCFLLISCLVNSLPICSSEIHDKDQPKLGMVVHVYNPSTLQSETGGAWVWGQPEIHSKFQTSLRCIVRCCLKK
jgi:hypothetical protein